jgi:single-strand DNA-binding protein
MSINRVCISGNLTRSPELRALPSGTSVLELGVAVNDRRKNQDGEWEDYPNYVDCSLFGKRAESLSKYLSKGQKVAIAGKLHYSSWEKDGQKRSKLSVIADDVEFMSRKGEGATNAPQTAQKAAIPSARPTKAQAPATEVYDEDIPF